MATSKQPGDAPDTAQTPREAVIEVLQDRGIADPAPLADRILDAAARARLGWEPEARLDTPEQMVQALMAAAIDGRSFQILGVEYFPAPGAVVPGTDEAEVVLDALETAWLAWIRPGHRGTNELWALMRRLTPADRRGSREAGVVG